MLKLLSGLFIALGFLSCAPENEVDLLIRDVRVVDVVSGQLLPPADLLLNNGKIAEIRRPGTAIKTKKTISGKGLFAMPGLWDFHVHFRGGTQLKQENAHLLNLYIANGITSVRDAGGDLSPALFKWRNEIREGKRLGPNIFISGPKLDGPNPRWKGSLELKNRKDVIEALDSLESLEVDYVKLYDSSISGDVYLAAIREAQQRGLKVSGHMPFGISLREAIESGLDVSEHMYYAMKEASSKAQEINEAVSSGKMSFSQAVNEALASYEEPKARLFFSYMAEKMVGIVPTLFIGEVLERLALEDFSDQEYLNFIGKGIRATYDGRIQSAKRRNERAQKNFENLEHRFQAMLRPMHKAGVRIYAGSDAGAFNSHVYPGISLHEELIRFVKNGLTPAEALRTATLNPASFFGLEHSVGEIKPGFEADILLLSANPLDKIENTQAIEMVILDGKHILDRAMRKRLLTPNL